MITSSENIVIPTHKNIKNNKIIIEFLKIFLPSLLPLTVSAAKGNIALETGIDAHNMILPSNDATA